MSRGRSPRTPVDVPGVGHQTLRMFTPSPLRRNLGAALRDLSATKPDVRASAARDLGIAGLDDCETAAAAVEPLLRDSDSQVRGEAALTLGTLGAVQYVDAIGVLLDDGDIAVRQYAVMALGEISGEAALTLLERAFAGAHADVRYQALMAIAAVDPRRGFDASITALEDPDIWIASEAALQLGERGAQHAETPVWFTEAHRARGREALRARLGTESARVSLCAAMALARLGDERGRDQLVRFVRGELMIEASDDASDLRLQAIELLGELGGADARACLESVAWRMFPSVQREVARAALARLGDERAAGAIVAQLRSMSGERRLAAVQLARAGQVRQAVPALVEILRSKRVEATTVIDALESINDSDARAALRTYVDDGSGDAEALDVARTALERMTSASSSGSV